MKASRLSNHSLASENDSVKKRLHVYPAWRCSQNGLAMELLLTASPEGNAERLPSSVQFYPPLWSLIQVDRVDKWQLESKESTRRTTKRPKELTSDFMQLLLALCVAPGAVLLIA